MNDERTVDLLVFFKKKTTCCKNQSVRDKNVHRKCAKQNFEKSNDLKLFRNNFLNFRIRGEKFFIVQLTVFHQAKK